jgi:hypothetical protein
MRIHRLEHGQRHGADARLRRIAGRHGIHGAGDDGVAGGREQIVLVGHVPVDGARPRGQARGQGAEGQAGLAIRIEQGNGASMMASRVSEAARLDGVATFSASLILTQMAACRKILMERRSTKISTTATCEEHHVYHHHRRGPGRADARPRAARPRHRRHHL